MTLTKSKTKSESLGQVGLKLKQEMLNEISKEYLIQ